MVWNCTENYSIQRERDSYLFIWYTGLFLSKLCILLHFSPDFSYWCMKSVEIKILYNYWFIWNNDLSIIKPDILMGSKDISGKSFL